MEPERALNMRYHCDIGLECFVYVNCVCSTGSILQSSFERHDCDIGCHFYRAVWVWDLRNHASYLCLAHRGCLLEYFANGQDPAGTSLARCQKLETAQIFLVCIHWHVDIRDYPCLHLSVAKLGFYPGMFALFG